MGAQVLVYACRPVAQLGTMMGRKWQICQLTLQMRALVQRYAHQRPAALVTRLLVVPQAAISEAVGALQSITSQLLCRLNRAHHHHHQLLRLVAQLGTMPGRKLQVCQLTLHLLALVQRCAHQRPAALVTRLLVSTSCYLRSSWGASVDNVATAVSAQQSSPSPSPTPATCGTAGNNAGTEMASMPVNSASACACSTLCASTTGCAGYTFVGSSTSCYLRSSWGASVDNVATAVSAQQSSPSPSPTPATC